MPKFNVYESDNLKPIATVTGQSPDEAQRTADATLQGTRPFKVRPVMTRAEIQSYLDIHGFARWQDRIGLAVYRDHGGKRAKHELTVGAERAFMYSLKDNRRALAMQWDIA